MVTQEPVSNSRLERSRQSALDATLDVVAELGFARMTMDAVASHAHVSKATMYRLWRSKDELIADAVAGLVAEIVVPDSGSLAGDIQVLIEEAVELYADERPRRLITEVLSEMSHNPDLATSFRHGWLRSRREALQAILTRARKRGELRKGIGDDACLDLIGGIIFYRFLVTGNRMDRTFAHDATDLVLRGIAQGQAD